MMARQIYSMDGLSLDAGTNQISNFLRLLNLTSSFSRKQTMKGALPDKIP